MVHYLAKLSSACDESPMQMFHSDALYKHKSVLQSLKIPLNADATVQTPLFELLLKFKLMFNKNSVIDTRHRQNKFVRLKIKG